MLSNGFKFLSKKRIKINLTNLLIINIILNHLKNEGYYFRKINYIWGKSSKLKIHLKLKLNY